MVSRMSCVLMRSSFDFKQNIVPKKGQNMSHKRVSSEISDREAQKFEDMFNSMEEVKCF